LRRDLIEPAAQEKADDDDWRCQTKMFAHDGDRKAALFMHLLAELTDTSGKRAGSDATTVPKG